MRPIANVRNGSKPDIATLAAGMGGKRTYQYYGTHLPTGSFTSASLKVSYAFIARTRATPLAVMSWTLSPLFPGTNEDTLFDVRGH